MGFIYKITNQLNDKAYIGLTTKTIEERWQDHLNSINRLKENRPLYYALAKYGPQNFSIEKIEEIDNNHLGEREIYWIDFFDTYNNGYNATRGGDGVWTRKIEQYTLSGELINTYNTITEAKNYTGISESVLRGVCQKRYKTAKKCLFKYQDDPTPIEELVASARVNKCYKRKVYQYALDGTLIAIWESIVQAEQSTGITNIQRGLNHTKPCNNFVWRTEDKDFFDNLDLTSIIVQLSLDNKIVAYYDSFLSAAKALGKKQGSAISESCRNIGYHKTAYGYKWRYLKDVLGKFQLRNTE